MASGRSNVSPPCHFVCELVKSVADSFAGFRACFYDLPTFFGELMELSRRQFPLFLQVAFINGENERNVADDLCVLGMQLYGRPKGCDSGSVNDEQTSG